MIILLIKQNRESTQGYSSEESSKTWHVRWIWSQQLAKVLLSDDADYTQTLDILKRFTDTKLDSSNIY